MPVATLRPFARAVRTQSAAPQDVDRQMWWVEEQFKRLTPRCLEQLKGLKEDLMDACRQEDLEKTCNQEIGRMFNGLSAFFWWWSWEYRKGAEAFFQNLALSEKEAMLWAGMWDGAGSEPGRTTKQALFHFANLVDASTVHPSTELGKMVVKHGDLEECNQDPAAREAFTMVSWNKGLIPNFWNSASRAFVQGMAKRNQSRVVIIVNKDLDPTAERSFYKSVLYHYELRQLVKEALRSQWFPQVLVVDLKGTCDDMIEAMKRRMMTSSSKKASWLCFA